MREPATLVGKGVGDALGMAFETQPEASEELTSWTGKFLPSEYHGLRAGQWTDDTMMAKVLAESIVSCGGYFPRDVADRYLAWYRSGDKRGMGKTTEEALERLLQGRGWTESGVEGAEGNGTAMRSAPLGLYFQEDLETVREFAQMDARITHRSREAEEGSVAVAVAVALLASQRTRREDLVGEVAKELRDCKVRDGLLWLAEQGEKTTPDVIREIGTKAHAVQTVPAAFAAFVLTESFVDCVETAIRAGGDTDTTAAIAGALAGTHYGLSGIPKYYRENLESFTHLRRLEKKLMEGPRSTALWAL
jgi:ADP-ribosyl-[dinitrogen reductase] hydrolase